VSGLTAYERETVVTMNDDDEHATVWTAQRRRITALKKNPAAELLAEGFHGKSAWARFRIPARMVSFRTTRVKREMTDEQRAAAAARLRGSRRV
jgi:hypothetical protein